MRLPLFTLIVALLLSTFSVMAHADPSPVPSLAPVISQVSNDAAQASIGADVFIADVVQGVQAIGGMSGGLKVSLIILLIIASMKVSFLNNLIWSKLGSLQVWLAPALGLIAGLFMLPSLSLPGLFAYVSTGIGATYLHEILDLVKAIPGLGAMYVAAINWLESILGGPAAQPPTS